MFYLTSCDAKMVRHFASNQKSLRLLIQKLWLKQRFSYFWWPWHLPCVLLIVTQNRHDVLESPCIWICHVVDEWSWPRLKVLKNALCFRSWDIWVATRKYVFSYFEINHYKIDKFIKHAKILCFILRHMTPNGMSYVMPPLILPIGISIMNMFKPTTSL